MRKAKFEAASKIKELTEVMLNNLVWWMFFFYWSSEGNAKFIPSSGSWCVAPALACFTLWQSSGTALVFCFFLSSPHLLFLWIWRFTSLQSLVTAHWNEHAKPAIDVVVQKVSLYYHHFLWTILTIRKCYWWHLSSLFSFLFFEFSGFGSRFIKVELD